MPKSHRKKSKRNKVYTLRPGPHTILTVGEFHAGNAGFIQAGELWKFIDNHIGEVLPIANDGIHVVTSPPYEAYFALPEGSPPKKKTRRKKSKPQVRNQVRKDRIDWVVGELR